MVDKTRSVREFVYVDVPKLYSLYSQVFEGITDRIVEERIQQLITGDIQSSVLSQATAESRALEASRRTESVVLHDHMYNRLESEMGTTLLDAAEIEPTDMTRTFAENPVVRVTGRAEIEDYERIMVFFDKLNQLGEAIAYAGIHSNPELQATVSSIRQALGESTGKAKRKELQVKLDKLTDPKSRATEQGLSQDPKLLGNLKLFGEVFNPNGYEVVVTPSNRPNVHYRGVLDKAWLRYEPQTIRHLYGGQSENPWSMVGIVTHIPGTFVNLTNSSSPDTQEPLRTAQEATDNPMMLDAYRKMFRTARVLERMFLESNTEIEIVISPLAIYREFQIRLGGK